MDQALDCGGRSSLYRLESVSGVEFRTPLMRGCECKRIDSDMPMSQRGADIAIRFGWVVRDREMIAMAIGDRDRHNTVSDSKGSSADLL